jgi:hypothetical protein
VTQKKMLIRTRDISVYWVNLSLVHTGAAPGAASVFYGIMLFRMAAICLGSLKKLSGGPR